MGIATSAHRMYLGQEVTVGCATDRQADYHLNWDSVDNGATQLRCHFNHPFGLNQAQKAMGADSVWKIKCYQP
jgi:hypothetical protein